ncbi:50S ribosomal protein L31 [Mycolicibacterium sp. 120322]
MKIVIDKESDIVVEISSASHPVWTGQRRIVDSAGQVEKFTRRYGRRTRDTPRSSGRDIQPS